MFDVKVLRRIFGPNREEITGPNAEAMFDIID
jgi:hypothetical protein